MKLDVKRSLSGYKVRHRRFDTIELPPTQYLSIDGHGDPNTAAEYRQAIETLYPAAYALKFLSREVTGKDYVVPPLEGLWWAEDHEAFTSRRDKSQWDWTMMIMAPDWISHDLFDEARERVATKSLPRLEALRFATLSEGLCVQTLHIGSYDDEGPVLATMHDEVIPERGLKMVGKHHEIYLSDARKVPADRLRTILRQPVTAERET